jgi:SAM-dependent methyltransferase
MTSVWGKSYKGLAIKSDYRVHELVEKIVALHTAGGDKKLRILDIATGNGALAQRIRDLKPDWDIEINDLEVQSRLRHFKSYAVDLNGNFGKRFRPGGYDLILAIEILEHLENPWHFMRHAERILKPGGYLILSTPNSDSWLDRAVTIMDGHATYFGERGYVNSGGHITAVPDWLLRKIAQGLTFDEVKLHEDIDTRPLETLGVRLRILLLRLIFFGKIKRANRRSINVYTLRKRKTKRR